MSHLPAACIAKGASDAAAPSFNALRFPKDHLSAPPFNNNFPNTSIEKEHYLIDTRRLRLDFYLEFENRMIGIEYQGIQTFEEVDYFGGENKLVKQKEWDENKRKICENLGIELIYFYHYENLSEELVRKKLCVK